MNNSARKDEIAKRAADAQMATVFRLPETMDRLRANLEESAYRALTSYEEERTPTPDFHRGMSLAELAEAQGVKAIADIRELAGVIPEGEDMDAFLASMRTPSGEGWQQRIFALRKDAPSHPLTDEEEAEHRGWTDAINAVLELFAGQNATDATLPASHGEGAQ